MKRMLFQELLIVSFSENRARRIPFNRRATVLRGPNGTGKSCLVKSLYWTLGAEPQNIHPAWKVANITSSLRFSVEGKPFRMVRNGMRFVLFDGHDRLLRVFTHVTRELGPFFAELCDFHLLLNYGGEDIQATPAFLFLPFYVDQDKGWTKPHESFDRLGQFTTPRKDAVWSAFEKLIQVL